MLLEALAIAGIAVYAGVFRAAHKRHQLPRRFHPWLGKPRIRIRKIRKSGTFKIVGTAQVTSEKLTAPLTGRACVAWMVIVKSPQEGVSAIGSFIGRAADLVLRDGTGEVKARLDAATVITPASLVKIGAGASPSDVSRFLDEHGVTANPYVELHEGIIVDGEKVALIGPVSVYSDPDPHAEAAGYREMGRRTMREMVGSPIIVTNHPSLR